MSASAFRTRVVDWRQFGTLMLLTAFTGSIIGLEQPVVPLLGARHFHLTSHIALLSFLVSFGVAKAVANLVAGRLCDRFGRRRVLLWGWTLGLAEPLLIISAPSWGWVVAANLLLGVQQGVCWTTAITMMVDRARPDSRGLAAGINELAGYGGSALATLGAGYLAARYGLRPAPFLPSLALVAAGFLVTLGGVSDTVRLRIVGRSWLPRDVLGLAFSRLRHNPPLLLLSQAGLVVNVFQALVTGLLPLQLASRGLGVNGIATILFAYTFTWGLGQGITGLLSDAVGRRPLIACGMAGQGVGLAVMLLAGGFQGWVLAAVFMGAARALAYPTLIAAVVDSATQRQSASALGVYRFYRDSGYWAGGLAGGAIADLAGIPGALAATAAVAALSGVAVLVLARIPSDRPALAPVLEAREA